MKKLDLSGQWQLCDRETNTNYKGFLPGCNYLDLVKNQVIEEPFWEMNENKATLAAEKDYSYSREFKLDTETESSDSIQLVIEGLDTIAKITINGQMVGETNNAYRTYRFDIKHLIQSDNNSITIYFKSPFAFIRENNKLKANKNLGMTVEGTSCIRKPAYHFGWDWGPNLPPVGISKSITIESSSKAKFTQVAVTQEHVTGQVNLKIMPEWEILKGYTENVSLHLRLTDPDGEVYEKEYINNRNKEALEVVIANPQLWWCNGLGNQPLYTLEVRLLDNSSDFEELDSWIQKIGLRTLRLDTSKDKWGNNFQFQINGVPVFSKGACWIPSDSFIQRTSSETLEFYISGANKANMNMLRVWGGGYYESDQFYDLCDQYGILVWQDFAFACMEYPLEDPQFLANVKQEVVDNVRRLRHHACLALWCGNNEIEFLSTLWGKNSKAKLVHDEFFFKTLRHFVEAEDGQTSYWPGSPSSGSKEDSSILLSKGDTHLWQVWHGMLPLESFRKFPTRFCSEFGTESLPSMHAIRSFTAKKDLTLFDEVMMAHQKSASGNEKMLFYLLSRYKNPETLEGFIYLSQLVQSETIRLATEFWRRNTGRCNGALYWQFNDCWPVASWAGIDYEKQYKAVQYRAKQFNAMLTISADMYKRYSNIHVINDYAQDFTGTVAWQLSDFYGKEISQGKHPVNIMPCQAQKLFNLKYKNILKGCSRKEVVLSLELINSSNEVIFRQTHLLVPDKKASLKAPNIQTKIQVEGETGVLALTSDVFARYIKIDIDGIDTPISDNFFDLMSGETRTVTFSNSLSSDKIGPDSIHITTLADIKNKGNAFGDWFIRFKIRMKKSNLIYWAIFKVLFFKQK